MATILDVARLAGVSKSTVSNVINGLVPVSDRTRYKVLSAIEELNFIPSSNAVNLKRTHSNEIGVILSDLGNSIHGDVLNGICGAMQRKGYFVNVVFTNGSARVEQAQIDMLLGKNPAGLIVLSSQDDHSSYFRRRFSACRVPVYFVLTLPQEIPCNTVAFQTRSLIADMTRKLFSLGYQSPSLVCGPAGLTNEREAMEGFLQVFRQQQRELAVNSICHTQMTKEDAFRVTVEKYQYNVPDVVIATSPAIAKGLLETAHVFSKQVGEDLLILCLGDSGWCRATQHGGVITTSLNCVRLGELAAKGLMETILAGSDGKDRTIRIRDDFDLDLIPPRPAREQAPRLIPRKNAIRILAQRFRSTEALDRLSRYFESAQKNATVHVQFVDKPAELLDTLQEEQESHTCLNDLYLFDTAWTSYLANHQLLRDLSPYVAERREALAQIVPGYLEACRYQGRYYGIPLVAGCQLLFYRRDYFEHPAIRKRFKEQTNCTLRPPRTWTEFRNICRFFTKSCNAASPTQFGTAFPFRYPEQLISTVLPFLWSSGARAFDENSRPMLDTKEFARGIRLYLETVRYADPQHNQQNSADCMKALIDGQCAMVVGLSEDAAELYTMHRADETIGFSRIPGKVSVFSGWNFGVSPFTVHTDAVSRYLDWALSPTVSYYLTILTGQTALQEPYRNNELLRLYPWLATMEEARENALSRRPPMVRSGGILNPLRSDGIITNIVYDIENYGGDLPSALRKAQSFAEHLIDGSGTPQTRYLAHK